MKICLSKQKYFLPFSEAKIRKHQKEMYHLLVSPCGAVLVKLLVPFGFSINGLLPHLSWSCNLYFSIWRMNSDIEFTGCSGSKPNRVCVSHTWNHQWQEQAICFFRKKCLPQEVPWLWGPGVCLSCFLFWIFRQQCPFICIPPLGNPIFTLQTYLGYMFSIIYMETS